MSCPLLVMPCFFLSKTSKKDPARFCFWLLLISSNNCNKILMNLNWSFEDNSLTSLDSQLFTSNHKSNTNHLILTKPPQVYSYSVVIDCGSTDEHFFQSKHCLLQGFLHLHAFKYSKWFPSPIDFTYNKLVTLTVLKTESCIDFLRLCLELILCISP